MPLSADRDLDKTRLALEEWVDDRMPEADGVTVSELTAPGGTGFSNETLLFDLEYHEEGAELHRSLVARIQVPEATVFPDLDVMRQAEVMRRIGAHSDVPVPEIVWSEPDPSIVGMPFFVMEKIEGTIPTDVPSYNEEGFVAEMPSGDRRQLWESAIDKLARVHRVDPDAAGLDFLDHPEDGGRGLPQLLAYLERYHAWALDGREYPIAEEGRGWVRAHRPADQPVGLCWGDARPSNMIFSGTECVGVLDWEMAVLGAPEQDLGWWVLFDRFSSEGYGVPRLEGLPGRAETLDHFEGLLGRPLDRNAITYYEVLAAYYFALIMVKVSDSLRGLGLLDEGSDFATNNPSTELLGNVLEERA